MARVGGAVTLDADGGPLDAAALSARVAYVPQDDTHLLPYLTVLETVMHSAELQLPWFTPAAEKEDAPRACSTNSASPTSPTTWSAAAAAAAAVESAGSGSSPRAGVERAVRPATFAAKKALPMSRARRPTKKKRNAPEKQSSPESSAAGPA